MQTFFGIDYGSKLAGTTAIAYQQGNDLYIAQSQKRQDADKFIIAWAEKLKPSQIFIDAPLSLPIVYRQPVPSPDFFYRESDKLLKAMSPMFLGGLTARAMALKHKLEKLNIIFYEVYPSALARILFPDMLPYKKEVAKVKDFSPLASSIAESYHLNNMPANSHQLDALLAWKSGYRFKHQQHQSFGQHEEGQIIV